MSHNNPLGRKLFVLGLLTEVVVGGIIGWQIANAQTHPWAVAPKARIPPPRRKPAQRGQP
jgi:hypothetical protein